jgi:hypothetical protein
MPLGVGEARVTGQVSLSGNEITDLVRVAAASWPVTQQGGQVDGAAIPGGVYIDRAATNDFTHGQCDGIGSTLKGLWALNTGTTGSVAKDTTTPAPWSPNSIKVTITGGNGSVQASSGTGMALPVGTSLVGSVLAALVAGQQYQVQMVVINTDTTNTFGAPTVFTAGTGAWPTITVPGGLTYEILTPAAVVVAVGETGDSYAIRVKQVPSGRSETVWLAHAMLEHGQPYVAPYVATSGGVTATNAASRVQDPAPLIDETQMWAAFRLRYPFASTFDRSYKVKALAHSPKLLWLLNEPAGSGTVADSSGNGLTGTPGAGVTLGQPGGMIGDPATAALFNNALPSTSRITSTYKPYVVGSQRTFVFWAYRNALTSDPLFGGSNAATAQLVAQPGSETVLWQPAGAGGVTWVAAIPGVGQWFQGALTYDDTTRIAELFINGVSKGQLTAAAGYQAGAGNFWAGASAQVGSWDGSEQAVAVYERILTPAEIADLSAPPKPNFAFDFQDDPNDMLGLYLAADNAWRSARYAGGAGSAAASAPQAFSAGDGATVIFACDAASVKVSVNGAPFVSVPNANVPVLAAALFDVGSQANANHLNAAVLGSACGKGPITDPQAADLHARFRLGLVRHLADLQAA